MQPETRYARSGEVHIAYQVIGDGPRDLVFVPGLISHVEFAWEVPAWGRFLSSLASFSRLVVFDKRGTGLSDRVAAVPTLEQRMDDVRAVMDAVGSERAALLGLSEGGPMSALFAATYPERTSALVLLGSFARFARDADHPWTHTREEWEAAGEAMVQGWGSGRSLALWAPSLATDEHAIWLHGRGERLAASPGAAAALIQMLLDIDVRHVLPAIRVPALVVHRTGDRMCPVEGGRYLAARIPGARLAELPGDDHLPWVGDSDAVVGEIEEFLTGVRREPEVDRVLATVLFTDIVGSTERAAALGDRRWRELLDGHHALVRQELGRFRGREVKTTGDGFLATFDGPARAIRCACAIRDGVQRLGVDIRAGLHTGECELMGDDVGGIAVHIGARVAASAAPGEVLVSSTVRDLVAGSGVRFADRGTRTLQGVPGEWRLLAVER